MPRPCLPNCLECGKSLKPDKHAGRGLKQFCSVSCGTTWRNKNDPRMHAAQVKAARVAARNRRKKSRKVHPGTPSRVKLKINGKRQLRSRYLMEKYLGRKLLPGEIVHHKDEDRQNDRQDNLQILTRAEHARLHLLGTRRVAAIFARCAHCGKRFELSKYQRRRHKEGGTRFFCCRRHYCKRGGDA